MPDFSARAHVSELMDDLSRPRAEFEQAYRELATINRKLGGIRAIERFLPLHDVHEILDVAAGGCDVGDALASRSSTRVVSLDINVMGLRRTQHTLPVAGDATCLPFPNNTFDAVICSLSFHHLTDDECVQVLREMWRV